MPREEHRWSQSNSGKQCTRNLANRWPSPPQCHGMRHSMPPARRFSQLSQPKRVLVRLCQSINYGYIEELWIAAGDPTFNPAPRVLVDVKLDKEEGPRQEGELPDFELCYELQRLMNQLDRIGIGKVARLEIHSGVPRRALIEAPITGDGKHLQVSRASDLVVRRL